MLKRGGLLAFCSPTEKDNLFPFGENIISEEFKENFLSNLFPIDIEDIDCYAIKYGFETDYICKDVAHFDMGDINGISEFYMTHSLGKLCDVSHSNIEKMKEYFGDQCILSAQVVLAIYGGSGHWKSTFTKDSTTLFKQITGG